MDSNGVSQRLVGLAQQLRSNKSQLGFIVESATLKTQITHQSGKPRKRAAVLICLFEGDEEGELRVILTKRASTLSSHSGEVALPGGKTDEGDADDIQTALREAEEEIGLDPSLVDVVAILEPLINKCSQRNTIFEYRKAEKTGATLRIVTPLRVESPDRPQAFSLFCVSTVPSRGITIVPVIGILSNKKAFHPVPNPSEVEAIFDAPLEMFLKDENRRSEEGISEGKKYLLQFFHYEAGNNRKYLIWALTAEILIRAASIVYQRPPAFTEWKPRLWHRSLQSRY